MGAGVLISGLVRNEGNFHHQLKWIDLFKTAGLVDTIVYSTWHGELEKYPDIFSSLKRMGVNIVLSHPPALITHGHVLHQSKCNTLGLFAFDNDAFVLKIRPDIMPLNEDYIPVLKREIHNQSNNIAPPQIFSFPVWIPSGALFWPFFLSDITYFGRRNDLLKLNDVDLKNEVYFNQLAAEQMFHLNAAIDVAPHLIGYAYIQRVMIVNNRVGNNNFVNSIFKNQLIFESWLSYAKILATDYVVGFGRNNFAPAFDVDDCYLDNLEADVIGYLKGLSSVEFSRHATSFIFNSNKWAVDLANDIEMQCNLASSISNWRSPVLSNMPKEHWNPVCPPLLMKEAKTLLDSIYVNEFPLLSEVTDSVISLPKKVERYRTTDQQQVLSEAREEISFLRKKVAYFESNRGGSGNS